MRTPTAIALVALLGVSGCLSAITDPLDRRGEFEETQTKFTQYVRWGKFQEASEFLAPELRDEFMALAPEFSTVRFSDYEITDVDIQDGIKSASVQVRYTGYRLDMPVEKSVALTEEWTRDEETGVWTVKLDIEKLRNTMVGVP
jgi:hypothetical protein